MENSNHQSTSIYGSGAMNMQQNLDEEDDVPGGGTGGGGEESIENPQIGYQESGGVVMVMNNGMEEASHANIYGQESDLTAVPGNTGVDQLTLSFQGDVYVLIPFLLKRLVRAVLLLLGGYEIPSGIPALGTVPVTQGHALDQSSSYLDMGDFPGRSIQAQRVASLNRSGRREKSGSLIRKSAIPYGQKWLSVASASYGWSGTPGSGQDGSMQETFFDLQGVLRDLSKVSTIAIQDLPAKTTERSDAEANDSEAVTVTTDVVSSSNER
ncbi:hypothetical protein CRYUN_Cryun18bG0084600 [Craigia yunnanensis]